MGNMKRPFLKKKTILKNDQLKRKEKDMDSDLCCVCGTSRTYHMLAKQGIINLYLDHEFGKPKKNN